MTTRTLLLSGTTPAPTGVGGVILHDLLPLFGSDELSGFFSVDPGGELGTPEGMAVHLHDPGQQVRPPQPAGLPARLLRLAADTRARRASSVRALDAAAAFGADQSVERVWAVLDTPTTIAIAEPLARRLGVPLVTTVWDDLEHQLGYFRVERSGRDFLRRRFADALRASRACAVIGEKMKAAYEAAYGVRSVIVRHGAGIEDSLAVRRTLAEDGPLRIGFAGSVTARTAFDALLAALEAREWRIGGREVELRLLGHRFDLRSRHPCRVEFFGWRSFADTVRLLGECQLNFLPQPFEPTWRPFAELSFPSKVTTYLAAGVPLFVLTPEYGSLRPFVEEHAIGALGSTLDPQAIAARLEAFLESAEDYAAAAATIERVRAELFGLERFRADFSAVLDASTAT